MICTEHIATLVLVSAFWRMELSCRVADYTWPVEPSVGRLIQRDTVQGEVDVERVAWTEKYEGAY